MIYEIRNYHFEPSRFEEYKTWAKEQALPFLRKELELVGFWTKTPDPVEVLGVQTDDLGSANITWIIRWKDMEQRNQRMGEVFTSDAWAQIFKSVPGGLDSYLRRESRFAEEL